ncbi:MAG: type 1 glutamine amidotransferase [Nitrospinae bacterium]|nr:type 1 glutamine amidotransferase [Nitrospinota bacterium]
MRLHYLQHVPFEGLGSIQGWAGAKGHSITCTRLFAGDKFPEIGEIDMLIIMGGPMNIYEEKKHPWLAGEKKFIEKAIAANKTVLGICLGAQLIADALGSRVCANKHKEIGWFPVQKTEQAGKIPAFDALSDEMVVFHWHGDTFDLPQGAIHAARSAACENQAFIYDGRVVGLQFHLETTRSGAAEMIRNCGNELVDGPFIQPAEAILSQGENFENINKAMWKLLDYSKNIASQID